MTLGDAGAAILDAGTGRDGSPHRRSRWSTPPAAATRSPARLISRLAAGDELVDAVATAVRVGAYAATGKGAQPSYPTSRQLAAWTP